MSLLVGVGWWVVRILVGVALAASLIPLIRSGNWGIRSFDFLRAQFAILAVLAAFAVVAIGLSHEWRRESFVLLGAAALALGIHGWRLLPFTPLGGVEVRGSAETNLRVVVSNVDYENEDRERVAEALEELDADVLLLLEVDEAWSEHVERLRSRYPHGLIELRDEGLGMALLSRHPLRASEERWLVSKRRVSGWAMLEKPGLPPVRLAAVHPTPPALQKRTASEDDRYDSRIRDAELVLASRALASFRGNDEAAGDAANGEIGPGILIGDFNDVPWSRTLRRVKKIGGLGDPRAGRGFVCTFHADSRVIRYPLDFVLVSTDVGVGDFRRQRVAGSDHFAVVADLFVPGGDGADLTDGGESAAKGEGPSPMGEDSREVVEQGVEDAGENNERAR